MTRVSTHGKCILVGEHAVVYGCPAIAMPIRELRFEMEIFQNFKNTLDMHIDEKPASNLIKRIVSDTYQLLNLEFKGAEITGKSDIPIGAGLGSSAAFCSGITQLVATANDLHLSKQKIIETANSLEKRFHGTPSGLDTATLVYNGPIFFRSRKNIDAIEPTKRFNFLIIDSEIRSPTLAMVQKAKPFFEGSKRQKTIDGFTKAVNTCKNALMNGDHEGVAESMTRSQVLLKSVGVVGSESETIIQKCIQAGCLSAKISGAGGGGVILALLPDNHEDSKRIKATLKQSYSSGLFIDFSI